MLAAIPFAGWCGGAAGMALAATMAYGARRWYFRRNISVTSDRKSKTGGSGKTPPPGNDGNGARKSSPLAGDAVVLLGLSTDGKASAWETLGSPTRTATPQQDQGSASCWTFSATETDFQGPYEYLAWDDFALLNSPDVADAYKLVFDLADHLKSSNKPLRAIVLAVDMDQYPEPELHPPTWLKPLIVELHALFGPNIWRHVAILGTTSKWDSKPDADSVLKEWKRQVVSLIALATSTPRNPSIQFFQLRNPPTLSERGNPLDVASRWARWAMTAFEDPNAGMISQMKEWLKGKSNFGVSPRTDPKQQQQGDPKQHTPSSSQDKAQRSASSEDDLALKRAALTEKAEALFSRERTVIAKERALAQREADAIEKETTARRAMEDAQQCHLKVSDLENQVNQKRALLDQREHEANANAARVQKLAEDVQAKEKELIARETTLEKRSVELETVKQHLAEDRKEAEQMLQEAVRKESRASELESVAELRLRDVEQIQADAKIALEQAQKRERELKESENAQLLAFQTKMAEALARETKAKSLQEEAIKTKRAAELLQEEVAKREHVSAEQPNTGSPKTQKHLAIVGFILAVALMLTAEKAYELYQMKQKLHESIEELSGKLNVQQQEVAFAKRQTTKAEAERRVSLLALTLSWIWWLV